MDQQVQKRAKRRRVLIVQLALGSCALSAPETASSALAYTATLKRATLELP